MNVFSNTAMFPLASMMNISDGDQVSKSTLYQAGSTISDFNNLLVQSPEGVF